ncbi:MAG: FAD-binding oxidoreductase [Deltaproteobacteria bacterium]|nr:FAD-binding oxidoreductase [Deltaproteobacteria bacterium]
MRESAEALAATELAHKLNFRWVEGRELHQASGSSRLGGAIFQPEDGGLDPVQLALGLANRGSFEIHQGTRVRGLEPYGDRLRLICEAGDTVAERVVLALNAYSPFLLPQLAAEVRPVRGQMLATEPGERPLRGVWYIDEGFQYLRQLSDGTTVLGGCRGVAVEEEVGYVESPTPRVQQALDSFLQDYFPDLAHRPVARRWAGTMAFTPNGLPSIGEIPHLPGAYYAAGLGGHGLSLGFTLGRYLAQWLQGEEVGPFIG